MLTHESYQQPAKYLIFDQSAEGLPLLTINLTSVIIPEKKVIDKAKLYAMPETWNKKEREKKKQEIRKEKVERRQERKDNTRDGNNLEDMMAYIDENGNLSSMPPVQGVKLLDKQKK